MASLMAVIVTMATNGVAFRPGFAAPKMGKNYMVLLVSEFVVVPQLCGSSGSLERALGTYIEDNDEQEIDVGDVLELQHQVLRDEA